MFGPDDPAKYDLACWILDQKPKVGDEFLIRVLDAQMEPSKGEPNARIYIRPLRGSIVPTDYNISYDGTVRLNPR